jgi:hypothetical protein
VVKLVSSPGCSRLEKLGLAGNKIRDKGAEALASSGLSRLKSLDLGLNSIGPIGAEALASSSVLAGLRSLRMSPWGGLGERGRALLEARFDDRIQFV